AAISSSPCLPASWLITMIGRWFLPPPPLKIKPKMPVKINGSPKINTSADRSRNSTRKSLRAIVRIVTALPPAYHVRTSSFVLSSFVCDSIPQVFPGERQEHVLEIRLLDVQ